MKKRPVSLTVFSILLFGIAISMPLQIILLYGHTFTEWSLVLAKLTWLNILIMGLSVMNGYLALLGDPWLKISVPCLLGLVTFNNFIVGNYGVDYNAVQTTFATLGFFGVHATLLFTQAHMVISHPELRWWLIPERKKLTLPVTVKNRHGVTLVKSFDISKTGLYLTPLSELESPLWKFVPGSSVELTLSSGLMGDFNVKAVVVRNSTGQKGHYPKGIGLTFESLSWMDRLRMNKMMSNQFQII